MTKVSEAMDMRTMYTYQFHPPRHYPAQRGASLIMVMLILVVVSLLGVGGAQIALMSERGARNDRDQQVAWQAAEAALIDAEFELGGAVGSSTRNTLASPLFDGGHAIMFIDGCGTSGDSIGLCNLVPLGSGKPAWLTVDFTMTGSSAPTTEFGKFTARTFAAGGVGIQPAKPPRYIIELVPDPLNPSTFLYRITAMGFGPRADIQAVLQTIYRI